jgi:phospholipase/lecithinase/hemolysin
VEQLARSLALAGTARPALRRASPGAANYAIGGARARDDHVNLDLPQQVGTFLANGSGAAPSDALYIVAIGGNDLRDALVAFVGTLQAGGTLQQAQAAAGAIVAEAVASVGENLQALAGAGARRFLVWKVPNIGATPAIRGLGAVDPRIPAVADTLTQSFNAALEANVLAPLEGAGLGVLRLDVYSMLNQVIGAPGDFGLVDVTHACITPSVAPFQCQRPDEFLFWDGIHPSAAGHALIAQRAASLLMR